MTEHTHHQYMIRGVGPSRYLQCSCGQKLFGPNGLIVGGTPKLLAAARAQGCVVVDDA
jgi:hypothetical protein